MAALAGTDLAAPVRDVPLRGHVIVLKNTNENVRFLEIKHEAKNK